MKSTTLSTTFTLVLLAIIGLVQAAPLPAPAPAPAEGSASLVLLTLDNGRMAKCTLASGFTVQKADQVSSKLIASGKMACRSGPIHAQGGGKTLHCEKGQLASNDEAAETLKSACNDHQGVHQLMVRA
ncbi:hypothetical protein NDA13_006341 [Ustilago tritici]|nr:hypothetical protein NDA13_006341 [Ustilago tritici]